MNHEITALISTSPSPRHPSAQMIEDVIWSIRWHLPRAPIIVCCDGVRPEQEHCKAAYSEYVLKLRAFADRMMKIRVLVQPEFLHQAWSLAKGLEEVQTPLVFVTEHDMEMLYKYFPWENASKLISDGYFNLIRFGLGDEMRDEWKPFMLGKAQLNGYDTLLTKTTQWSQRTHLASTSYYRKMIAAHLKPSDRCYLEDRLYGQCDDWNEHRLTIYTPIDSIAMVKHLDGRQNEPKFASVLEGK